MGRQNLIAGVVAFALVVGIPAGVLVYQGAQRESVSGPNTVEMRGMAYVPSSLTVSLGTTVTWTNRDAVYHTVTSNAPGGVLYSTNIQPGESWSFTFTRDSTVDYHCIPHSNPSGNTYTGMVGTVIVGNGLGVDGVPPLDLPHSVTDARTSPPSPGWHEWSFTLVARELPLMVAPGVPYAAWTFNGELPGPALRVRQGDLVHIRLINEGTMNHSIDFHSARIAWNLAYVDVPPGATHTYSFTADYPGVFMYHCGSSPVLVHVANGMYGVMIVDPASDTRPVPDEEYALVLSEVYASDKINESGIYVGDVNKMLAATPTQVVFNGYAFQYHPGKSGQALTAKAGERIRLYVLNAGPTIVQSFHVIGAIFDGVYVENNPENMMEGIQTWTLPSSGGAAFDLIIPDVGLYPFVTHSFAYTGLGAVGVIQVTA